MFILPINISNDHLVVSMGMGISRDCVVVPVIHHNNIHAGVLDMYNKNQLSCTMTDNHGWDQY